VALLAPQIAVAQTDSQSNAIEVLCLTERPAIDQGASTRLQAWAVTPDGQHIAQSIAFEWQVSGGAVQGTGPDVQWNLSGVKIDAGELHKKVTATVKTRATGLSESTCIVEVFIGKKEDAELPGPPSDRGGLRSARRYLLPDQKEEAGFGLYSYLLFSNPPQSAEEKARYLKTLESCLLVMQSVEDHIKRHRRPSELNATHIPVTALPKYSQNSAEWAANALAVYDYTTAQKLLDKLDKTYQRGPYVISVLKQALSYMPTPIQLHLLQDFTGKVPELVSNVVDLFTYRAAQQRTWSEIALRSFGLNVRNLIVVAGKVTPDVASAVIKLIQWKTALNSDSPPDFLGVSKRKLKELQSE
jgi:hypothetical protein